MEVTVRGIKANDKTYDGTMTATLITNGSGLYFDGKKSNDTLTVTATGTFVDPSPGTNKTVNITNLSLGGASEGNYKLASSGNQTTTTATIKQRSITLKSDSATKEYDEKPLTKDHVTISGAGFLSGEGVTCTVTGSQTEVGSSQNLFTYSLKEGTDPNNYTIKREFGTLTVKKRSNKWTTFPSITDWTYGADPDTVVNKGETQYGRPETITMKYKGKGDTVYKESETPPTAVGTYNIFIEQPETETDGGISYQKDFTITPKEVGLSWSDLTFTYDGDSHKPVAEATDLVEGDTCTVAVKGEKTDQGTYTATASSLSNTNYKLPSANTTEFTIEPCATTIDIAVSDMIYTGEALKPVPTVRAVANNNKKIDASEYMVTYEDNTDVGTAAVTVADKDNGNYIITGNSETFAIIKKSIANDNAETADNKEGLAEVLIKDFPDATYSGVEHTPEADISYNDRTLQPGEDYTISYEDNVAKGKATVTITGKGSYKGTVEKHFAIHKSRVTILAENKTSVYGSDLNELSYTVSGTAGSNDFIYADDLEGLAIRLHTDAKKSSPAGAYPINVKYTENDNYEITVVPGVYTIAKKGVTIKADAKTKVYGTTNPTLTYTTEGIIPGDSPLSGSLSVNADEETGVGDYDIVQGTVAADDNYYIAEYVGAKLTVEKAAQARPVYGKDFTYQKETGSDKATFIAYQDGLGLYERIDDDYATVAIEDSKAQIDVGKTYYVRREEQPNYKPSGYTAFTAERAPKVTVKVEAAPKGCGTASVKKSDAAGSGSGSLSVEMGTEITVSAVPKDGFLFAGWMDADKTLIPNAGEEYTFKAYDSRTITAEFVLAGEKVISVPTPSDHTYDGTEQTGVAAGEHYTLSGDFAATDAGSYKAAAEPEDGYYWNDGTQDEKQLTWKIKRGEQNRPKVTETNDDSFTVAALKGEEERGGVLEYKLSDGKDYVVAEDVTVSGLPEGKYYLRYAATDNYEASTSTIVNIGDLPSDTTNRGVTETLVDIISDDTPEVKANGLEEVIEPEDERKAEDGTASVEIRLDVERKDKDDAEGAKSIGNMLSDRQVVGEYLDIKLFKTTVTFDSDGNETSIDTVDLGTQNTAVLELAVPYTTEDGLTVFRYHNSEAEALTKLSSRAEAPYEDGTFYIGSGHIYIYASGFSTYAIVKNKPIDPVSAAEDAGNNEGVSSDETSGMGGNGKSSAQRKNNSSSKRSGDSGRVSSKGNVPGKGGNGLADDGLSGKEKARDTKPKAQDTNPKAGEEAVGPVRDRTGEQDEYIAKVAGNSGAEEHTEALSDDDAAHDKISATDASQDGDAENSGEYRNQSSEQKCSVHWLILILAMAGEAVAIVGRKRKKVVYGVSAADGILTLALAAAGGCIWDWIFFMAGILALGATLYLTGNSD